MSLLTPLVFTLLDRVAQSVRDCPDPFGGLKIISAGDFLGQIPPPPVGKTPHEAGLAGILLCFQSPSWISGGFDRNTLLLTTNHTDSDITNDNTDTSTNSNELHTDTDSTNCNSGSGLGLVECRYDASYAQMLHSIHKGHVTMNMLNLLNTCDVKYKTMPSSSSSSDGSGDSYGSDGYGGGDGYGELEVLPMRLCTYMSVYVVYVYICI